MPDRSSTASPSFEMDMLLASARRLQRADANATVRALLHGKILGLVCEAAEGVDARLFQDAATGLGARVTHILPGVSELGTADDDTLANTARVLGRLYDGIECQGLAPALVERLRRAAGVPVFDGLATALHPTAGVADLLSTTEPLETRRRLVVQAALLSSLLALDPTHSLARARK
jgi:ornithine carbamoyltransferase